MQEKTITLGEEILEPKNMLVMKILHYLIIDRHYNPIVIQGADNEIWLENLDEEYRVVRIVTGTILNEEQLGFDIFKTKRIIRKIKKKTFTFNIKTLSIFLNLDKSVELNPPKDISCVTAENETELKKNTLLEKVFPDMKDKLKYTEEGLELFAKITGDINEHNIIDNEKAEKVFKPKYPLITYILIALNVLLYILPIIYNKEVEVLSALCVHTNSIKLGQYYRLLTGAFQHANFLHLLCNMYALYILGSQLESFIGKIKYVIVYLFSAVTASLMSMIFLKDGISVGASGAIFGIMGAILYFGYHYRVYLGNVIKTNLLPVIILNLFLGFTVHGIDNWGHIGGLIGGLLINIGLGVKYKSTTFERINGIITSLLYLSFLIFMNFFYVK
ncbi:MAG: rhomboid family intramembrane serine protease [Bacilli bacterium]|nr:rhomboid family intramembrane serine protease [Bacilli bacterium]